MNRILSLTITFLIAFVNCAGLRAQTYQWAEGGGSSCSMSPTRNWERVTNFCTDGNRNIYAIAVSGGQDITVDTFYTAMSHFGTTSCAASSALILSYNCSGRLRWIKLFDTYGMALGNDIKYDNAGSLYVVGYIDPSQTKYFTDTAVTNPYYSSFIMKYDTSGKLAWMRFIGASNLTNQFLANSYSKLAVDGQGNPHQYVLCKTGVQLTPTLTATGGTYDLKYSPSGNLLSVTRLQVDSNWYIKKALISPSGKLYASFYYDYRNGIFNSGITAFSATGAVIWQDTTGRNCGVEDFAYDGPNNSIYLAGEGDAGGSVSYLGSLRATNTTYPTGAYSVLGKIDTNGNAKWLNHWDGTLSIAIFNGISKLPNGKLALTGLFVGKLRKGADSIVTPATEGQNPFMLIADTAGNTIKLDQLHGSGFYDWGTACTADNAGNFYIGGQFESNITATGLGSGISSTGGNTDFFIMKYGYLCNCNPPTANYSAASSTGKTVRYTYTGSIAGLDSLIWDFGDGQKQTVKSGFSTPVLHTFTANGRYTVCVTAYGSCGTNTHCDQTPLSVSGMAALQGVSVYPNPAEDVLTIEGAAGAGFILSNHIGQQVLQGHIRTAKEEIDISSLPSGSYLLQLTDKEGQRGVMMVLKQ